ncbi:recombinase family protein [Larkinella sp.]|uniref:recombinase family protein n=1 Tax=Larkinella sp. TaxID=2034517 RepID=UPI003BAC51C3
MTKKSTPALPATTDKKYVVYYRVSTKKQGESGLGLEAQQAYVSHFYGTSEIIAEYTDVRSGKTITRRPELMKAIKQCKAEGATLVVAKIDRLSRNTEQALWIYRELSERLESCDIPNLDKFTLTLFMAIADRERELIGIRTKQALDQKRLKVGEWRLRGHNPKKAAAGLIGARMSHEQAADNENNRRASAMVSMLRGQGKTYASIAEELNRAGFKTATGKLFQPTQVMRLNKISKSLTELNSSVK